MPELPEVECVRRSLERRIVGRRVVSVRVNRPQIIRGSHRPAALLVNEQVAEVLRHGKQLAIVGRSGGCVCVHLGMSGQLCVVPGSEGRAADLPPKQRKSAGKSSEKSSTLPPHTHVVWRFDGGLGLRFTDPRRFGGLWVFDNLEALRAERWSALGADALSITPARLHKALGTTTRCLKAALLDQALVAGLGNIYVDELLFTMKLHPLMPADAVDRATVNAMVRRMRTLLSGAVERGGSTLRDYVDAESRQGSQQTRHRVYGRSGLRCKRRACGGLIASAQIAGRTTAWCPGCQGLTEGG